MALILILSLVLGFILGLCAMAATWAHDEKTAVRRGFIEIGDSIYRLTRVSLRDLKGDIDE